MHPPPGEAPAELVHRGSIWSLVARRGYRSLQRPG